MINEAMTKSVHNASFLVDDLRDALRDADMIESIILLKLINDSATLLQRIEELENAIATNVR